MNMKFFNVNPAKLLQEFNYKGIKVLGGIKSNLKEGEYISKEAWCEFKEGTDMDIVNDIVNKHNPEVVKEPSFEELLIKEIANLKIEIMQLKGGNA